MEHARRRFLHAAGTAMLTPLLLRDAEATQVAAAEPFHPDSDTLAPYLGREFQAAPNTGAATSLRLVSIEQPAMLKGYRDPVMAARNCFILIFRSKRPGALAEGIHTFSRPGLTPFSAFISPIDADGRTYQIVYNRNMVQLQTPASIARLKQAS